MNSKLIILVLGASSLMASGEDYGFNLGNSAGWTYSLVNGTTSDEIRSGSAGWSDINDYPNVFTDPVWDNYGAAQAWVLPSDYSKVSPGDYLLLDFLSPDLTKSDDWQSASIFTARLLPSFTAGALTPDMYANMYVIVNDLDTGTVRTFYSDTATPIADATWTYRDFDLASRFAGASPAVVNYEVQQVIIRFWIAVAADRDFGSEYLPFDIDNVFPHWTPRYLGAPHLGPGFVLP
jgi:hypothetical protein